MRQQKSINAFTAHRAAVKSIVVDDAGERFFTGSTDGEIRVRSPALGPEPPTTPQPSPPSAGSLTHRTSVRTGCRHGA